MYNPHREMIIIFFFFPFFLSFLVKIKEEERHCQLSCWLPTGDETIGEGKKQKKNIFILLPPPQQQIEMINITEKGGNHISKGKSQQK